MKKLVIGLCAVAMSAVTQASSFNWQAPGADGMNAFYSWKLADECEGADLYGVAGAVTFYLFDAGVAGSQSDMLTALRNGSSITDFTSVGTATLSDASTMPATVVSYGETGNTFNFYMAAVVDDKVLLSGTESAKAQQATAADITSNPLDWSDGDAYEGHDSRFFGDASYANAGWYNTAAAPEPTSGLLLLIGMAGLALRRRRA